MAHQTGTAQDEEFGVLAAAEYLAESPFALNSRRARGQGPRYIKRGRRVIYLRPDLDAYRASRVRQTP